MGLVILFVALGIIPTDESKFHAPHWVVGAAGLMFFLAGIAILTGPALSRVRPIPAPGENGEAPAGTPGAGGDARARARGPAGRGDQQGLPALDTAARRRAPGRAGAGRAADRGSLRGRLERRV